MLHEAPTAAAHEVGSAAAPQRHGRGGKVPAARWRRGGAGGLLVRSGAIVSAPPTPRTRSASPRRCVGATAAAQRPWQGGGMAARGGCLFSGADGAVVCRARPLLRVGCSGAAFGAASKVVCDAAARRRENFRAWWAMALFVRTLTHEDHLCCEEGI